MKTLLKILTPPPSAVTLNPHSEELSVPVPTKDWSLNSEEFGDDDLQLDLEKKNDNEDPGYGGISTDPNRIN